MKIVFISDTHGYLPKDLPEGDVLCICGDIFPLSIQTRMGECEDWLENKFIPWTIELPFREVIIIAGNHDFYFEDMEPIDPIIKFQGTKITYLRDSWVMIGGVKFYGTPWCHQFGRWAFMIPDEKMENMFKHIPENLDFLLTHDAPYGTSDICLQFTRFVSHDHIGNKPLRDAIINKKPKYVIHGHLHSSAHAEELLEESKVYNVSLLNENYEPIYEPLVIEYERTT